MKHQILHTWRSFAGFQSMSYRTSLDAPIRLSPTPPALELNRNTAVHTMKVPVHTQQSACVYDASSSDVPHVSWSTLYYRTSSGLPLIIWSVSKLERTDTQNDSCYWDATTPGRPYKQGQPRTWLVFHAWGSLCSSHSSIPDEVWCCLNLINCAVGESTFYCSHM